MKTHPHNPRSPVKIAGIVLQLVLALLLAPALYAISIGPMAPILCNSGQRGYRIWQVVYGEPLGKLPPRGRGVVNAYMGWCDRKYHEIRSEL